MRRIRIIFAMCALMAADSHAQSSWDEQERQRPSSSLMEWLPSILPGSQDDAASSNASEPEPAATQPAAPSRRQQRSRAAPTPEPEPEPERTPEEEAAEAQWWEQIGDPAVAAFSRCLAVYVADETSLGSQASYPEFVTAAMNSHCSREFGAMAHVILEHHGEDNFAKIARRLIATEFVPTVRQVAEGGLPEEDSAEEDPPEVIEPQDDGPTLEVAMRQSKEAMFGCLMNVADRLAATSAAPPERVADLVIASCQTSAEAYFRKLEQLYPGATGGATGEKSAALLNDSYRPAIVQRIDAMRAENGRAENGRADSGRGDSVRADRDSDSR